VAVTVDAAARTLTVEDAGPGLPPEAIARLGERFYRAEGAADGGSGLGWSLVRRIAALHRIGVAVDRSPALGGLRVVLRFDQSP
jgi:two-component system sensor histidine kinase QseC